MRRVPHELWIAIVTAVATIVTAVIGTLVAVDAGTVEVRVVGDGPGSAELQSVVDRLEAENAELRSANEDYRAQVDELRGEADATPAGLGESAASGGDEDGVRRATTEPITLAESGCLDLDSLEADAPNWDVGDEGDVCVDILYNFIGTDLTVLDEEPSLADCEAQTYLRDDVGDVAAVVGRYICASTDGGRLARIEVVGSERSERTDLSVTVWETRH
ncbi:hypothetical protein [Promicromonospora sp. NPDC057488]|uniref:hypothetical protein n=1 Tax=Promicromonospora sp. NPDC057488 TaxID=3346147 RepID=UPI00366BF0D7